MAPKISTPNYTVSSADATFQKLGNQEDGVRSFQRDRDFGEVNSLFWQSYFSVMKLIDDRGGGAPEVRKVGFKVQGLNILMRDDFVDELYEHRYQLGVEGTTHLVCHLLKGGGDAPGGAIGAGGSQSIEEVGNADDTGAEGYFFTL